MIRLGMFFAALWAAGGIVFLMIALSSYTFDSLKSDDPAFRGRQDNKLAFRVFAILFWPIAIWSKSGRKYLVRHWRTELK